MTMGDDSPLASLVLPVLIRPILEKLERKDVDSGVALRNALAKVEAAHPGFCHDFVVGLVQRADVSVNMNESLLRLHATLPDTEDLRSSRAEELGRKSASLKKILSRIPDEINDRKTFLETIKEIASAIKKLLDAVNEVSAGIGSPSGKQALEHRKREFVKYSKKFSSTLKDYFRDGQANAVFGSATLLIYQTNLIVSTVKDSCE